MKYGIKIITTANMSNSSQSWKKTERGYECFMVGKSFDNLNDAFSQLTIYSVSDNKDLYCEVQERPHDQTISTAQT